MDAVIETMKIRPLVPEDRDRVYAFFRRLGEEGTYFFNRHGGNEQGTYQYLNGEKPDRIYWAAVADTPEGEEIAGIVFLFHTDTKVPYLGIAISEQWKGRHLGRRLMSKNVRGQGLYERMGYRRIGNHTNGELLYLLAFSQKATE